MPFETYTARRRRKACPQAELHATDQPAGYLAWHAWASEMAHTHDQRKCPGCGRWQIWEPKGAES